MKPILKFAAFFLIAVFVFVACKKEKLVTPPPITNNNKPPVANAGAYQFIVLPTDSAELSGSGTDPDGNIVSYSWSNISGPSSFIVLNPNAAVTKVKNLVEGVYVFELKVTDNDGLSAKDKVIVTVSVSPIDPCNGCWDY